MGEILERDVGTKWGFGDNLRSQGQQILPIHSERRHQYPSDVLMKPLGAQFTMDISIVPVVVPSHMLENISHTLLVNLWEERPDESFMDQIGKVLHAFLGQPTRN